jgi:hypothetical protein
MQTVVGVIITVKNIACLHSFRVSDYKDAISCVYIYPVYVCSVSSVARDLSVMVSNGDMNSAADVGVL